MRRLILGPPGTGKTRTLLGILRAELERGVPPERIGFVSFTKAAVTEACERIGRELGIVPSSFSWARTLHSACYKLQGRPEVMGPKGLGEFADAHGYTLRGDPDDEPTRDDLLMGAMAWARARRVPLLTALADDQWSGVAEAELELFARRYAAFKADKRVIDFADMLEHVATTGARPPVDVLVVDESQDLSPIQAEIVDAWARPCERVYVAGDDDQAIYAFGGGDPAWVLGLAEAFDVQVLDQSWRVPRAVHRLAESISSRISRRVPKLYRPRDEVGQTATIDAREVLDHVGSGAMVLARTRRLLWPVANELLDAGIPFCSRGLGLSPLDSAAADAVRVLGSLAAGKPVRPRQYEAALAFIPSRGSDLLPHGHKAEIGRRQTAVALADIPAPLRRAIERHGPVWPLRSKLSRRKADGLHELWRRHGGMPEPRVELSTIHRSKGREHDTVIVLGDWGRMPSATLRRGGVDADAEHRVAYVAVTRARQRLMLVRSGGGEGYPWPA